MSVATGGRQRTMSEPGLDLAQIDTGLQQMRHPAVTNRMDGGRFLSPGSLESLPRVAPWAGMRHPVGALADRSPV